MHIHIVTVATVALPSNLDTRSFAHKNQCPPKGAHPHTYMCVEQTYMCLPAYIHVCAHTTGHMYARTCVYNCGTHMRMLVYACANTHMYAKSHICMNTHACAHANVRCYCCNMIYLHLVLHAYISEHEVVRRRIHKFVRTHVCPTLWTRMPTCIPA